MSTYKKFLTSDIASIPFTAHKQYTFTSSSAAALSINLEKAEYTSSALTNYSSASTDSLNTIKSRKSSMRAVEVIFVKNSSG